MYLPHLSEFHPSESLKEVEDDGLDKTKLSSENTKWHIFSLLNLERKIALFLFPVGAYML